MRLTLLLIVGLLASACGTRQYASDATTESHAIPVVGHCYQLRRDVTFTPDATTKTLQGGGHSILRYAGFIYVNPDVAQIPANGRRLPSGTRFVVEIVIAEHLPMVGTVLKPYVRFDGDYGNALAEASALFEFNADSEILRPISGYIQACR